MRTTYYSSLHHNPQIRLCWFLPLIRAAERTGRAYGLKEPVELSGWDYSLFLTPEIRINEDGLLALTLRWEDEGEQHSQTIPIEREESHLIKGSFVYFFLCPFGYKSKKLFYIGSSFRSRRAFPHRYRQQTLSRQMREAERGRGEEPFRKYGKEYYRGKITPYGRRCKRFLEDEERRQQAFCALAAKLISKNN